MQVIFALLLLGVCGCALRAPERGEIIAGTDPPVARARFETRLRHTDVVSVDVLFPSDAEGRPALGERTRAAIVFVQGGLVRPEAYWWLGAALAQRGMVMALPGHDANLAILGVDNALGARELLVAPPAGSALDGLVDAQRIAIAGHSLGGGVAAKVAVNGGFAALALLASVPEEADGDRLQSIRAPSLLLAGERDCRTSLEEVLQRGVSLPEPRAFAVLQGVTHFQFTADDAEDREAGCGTAVQIEQAHARIQEALGVFLDAALERGETGASSLEAIDGVEVRTP